MIGGSLVRASPAYSDVEPAAVAAADTRVTTIAGPALWLFSSNLLYAACQWGTVVALAKLGAPASLGHLGLALAIATPVVLVTGFALRSYQATDVLRRYAFTDYLNLRLAANVVAAAIILAFGTFGGIERAAVAILIPIGAAKIAEATSETCYGLAQRHEKMRFVAISRMVRGALGLGALVGVMALGGTLAAGAWAMAGMWTVFLLLVDLRAARTLEPIVARPDPAVLWRLARESAPLGAMHGVYAVTQSSPRYFLALAHGATAVGYFTALSAVGPAMAQLAAAVCQAAAPRLGWAAAGDGSRYRALVLRLLGTAALAGALLVGGAALVGHRFLVVAYTEDYAAYQGAFVLLVLAAALGVVSEVAYIAMVAARRLGLLLGVQCCGLLATALGAMALVPAYGVGGAAVAAALGSVGALVPATFILLGRRRVA
jgi:O-antigen/teichoic acid export membrane protein